MPYCAVFGCNSDSKKDKGVSWFRFPSEAGRNKTWLHYCKRKDFIPTKHSRICSKHFSDEQYSRNPVKLAQYGYAGARAILKENALATRYSVGRR